MADFKRPYGTIIITNMILVSQIMGGLIGRPSGINQAEETPLLFSSQKLLQPIVFNSTPSPSSEERKMSQYHINDTNCFNNTDCFNNVWNNYTVADDRSQLLAWLSPLEPRLRHRDLQERRIDNVGEWLIQTEEFRRWHDWSVEGEGDNVVLFCYGDPGAGKTFIR